ncbi:gamma-glutamylcyclotransferase family protein [Gallaecimonas pentaromativorans]|uniref:gamma-glutamylcyclotransferase family protein n=1 Tax=Gallaecimonas pentaromativorans TaxID=584787 RepID=UPI003A8F4A7D
MHKLFSYGTLQLPQVQQETFGRLLQGDKDSLPGYVLASITIRDPEVIRKSGTAIHPILQYTGKASDQVPGTVFVLTDRELAQSDAYEVEEYRRVEAVMASGQTAWIYADASEYQAG